jgi:hypothetical protein
MSRVVDQLLGVFYGKPSSRKRKESHLLISSTSPEIFYNGRYAHRDER